MKVLRTCALVVGESIVYMGNRLSRDNGKSLSPGDIGRALEIHPPRPGTGLVICEDDGTVVDDGKDGYAVVQWPSWGRALVWPDAEGERWRRVRTCKPRAMAALSEAVRIGNLDPSIRSDDIAALCDAGLFDYKSWTVTAEGKAAAEHNGTLVRELKL